MACFGSNPSSPAKHKALQWRKSPQGFFVFGDMEFRAGASPVLRRIRKRWGQFRGPGVGGAVGRTAVRHDAPKMHAIGFDGDKLNGPDRGCNGVLGARAVLPGRRSGGIPAMLSGK